MARRSIAYHLFSNCFLSRDRFNLSKTALFRPKQIYPIVNLSSVGAYTMSDYVTRMLVADKIKEKESQEEKESDKADHDYYSSLKGEAAEQLVNEILSFDIIDDMYDKGYIPMIYNGCYGRFGWSMRAGSLFTLIKRELGIDHNSNKENDDVIHGKVIRYLDKIGKKAGKRYGDPVFDFVRKDLRSYMKKYAYDGEESLEFDDKLYFQSNVKEVMQNSMMNNDEKVKATQDLIDEKITNAIEYYGEADKEMIASMASSSDRSRRSPVLQIPCKVKEEEEEKPDEVKVKNESIV